MSDIFSQTSPIPRIISYVLLNVFSSFIMSKPPSPSTFVSPLIASRKDAVLSAIYSVSSPASSSSVFAPRIRMVTVFHIVPTVSGSWITLLAATTRAIDSSIVLLAAAKEAAERWSASPMPPDEIANLLPTSLNLSTILIASPASRPKPFIVEIRLVVA